VAVDLTGSKQVSKPNFCILKVSVQVEEDWLQVAAIPIDVTRQCDNCGGMAFQNCNASARRYLTGRGDNGTGEHEPMLWSQIM
jgi:hypothetical protein